MHRMTIAVAAVSLIVLVGCASSTPGKGIAYPHDPDDLVLRIDFEGGFVPPTAAMTRIPMVSIFGDGTIVTQGPQIEIFPGPALPSLNARKVTEDGMQAILRRARDAGLLAEDREFRADGIADAATTVFTVVEGDRVHTTKAYALDETGPNEQTRPLVEFRNDLTDLPRWLPAGSLTDEKPYTASRVRVVAGPYNEPEPGMTQKARPWPVSADPATFGDEVAGTYRCVSFDGAEAETLLTAAREANTLTPWTHDGDRFEVAWRPLMPDEPGCPGQAA